MELSNHRCIQKSGHQDRMFTAMEIVIDLAVLLGLCLVLIPVHSEDYTPQGARRWGTDINFGNIRVYDETAGCGASRNSMSLPTVAIVTESSAPLAEKFGGAKIAGKGGSLVPQAKVALIKRLSGLPDGLLPPLTEPAPDLSCADETKALGSSLLRSKDISGGGQIIYLPDALYWPHSDSPPETTVVCGVIIQGAYGWGFVLNSVTPDEPRVRAAVVETFQRCLFIAGKGEVWQPYKGIFIDGQRCSEISGGKYAIQ